MAGHLGGIVIAVGRTLVATVTADNSNLVPTPGDAVNDHYFVHSNKRVLIVRNSDTAPKTVTAAAQGSADGNEIAEYTVTVLPGATVKIDTRRGFYRHARTGWVHVHLADATAVALGVLDLS